MRRARPGATSRGSAERALTSVAAGESYQGSGQEESAVTEEGPASGMSLSASPAPTRPSRRCGGDSNNWRTTTPFC